MVTRLSPAARDKPDTGYVLFALLHITGLLLSTLLMTWGALVLFFVTIGGFSLDGTVHQVANLTTRYLAAAPDRITQFQALVIGLHLIVGGTILFFRRSTLLPRDPLPREQTP